MTATWLLALESSTAHGGAALLRGGEPYAAVRLSEGLRHGRELLPAAEKLLADQAISAADVDAIAVSFGPGSYTGIRVGVMAAKAFAFGRGCRLAAVSSLAALAQSLVLDGKARDGDRILTVQDARRDEVYAGLYAVRDGVVLPLAADVAVTPEEAAARLGELRREGGTLLCAGSGFASYADLFNACGSFPGAVDPAAVGVLGARQLLQEQYADPMTLQPVYLRRDEGSDWRHDILITEK